MTVRQPNLLELVNCPPNVERSIRKHRHSEPLWGYTTALSQAKSILKFMVNQNGLFILKCRTESYSPAAQMRGSRRYASCSSFSSSRARYLDQGLHFDCSQFLADTLDLLGFTQSPA